MLLDRVVNRPWLCTQETLELIVNVASRQQLDPELARQLQAERAVRPSALALRTAQPLEGSKTVGVRAGVAIVPIVGPLIRHADVFTRVSGLTSVETVATDVQLALDSPAVRSLLLSIDSPGGEVTGIAALAEAIRQSRARKPIMAYVEGLGASAGYWLASAAAYIVVEATAALGSIGAVLAVRDPTVTRSSTIEFVSSQSPHKRPNPYADEGRAQYQRIVDQTAEAFIEAVASNRRVLPKTVVERYGAGGLLVGRYAVAAGLADSVGHFEGTLMSLAAGNYAPASLPHTTAAVAAVAEAAEVEQARAVAHAYAQRANGSRASRASAPASTAAPTPTAAPLTEEEHVAATTRAWAERQNRQERRK